MPPAAIFNTQKSLDYYISNFYFFSYFFNKMATIVNFGFPKITFDLHFSPFQSSTQLVLFLNARKSPLITFLAISDQSAYFVFFGHNGHWTDSRRNQEGPSFPLGQWLHKIPPSVISKEGRDGGGTENILSQE